MSDAVEMDQYDVLIEGTNLANAVLAAALSQAGLKVVHLDRHDYYGDVDANVLPRPSQVPAHVSDYQFTEGAFHNLLGQERDYNIELSPRLLYAASDMVQTLRDAGISEYIEFRALNAFQICRDRTFVRVPSSKADIFTDDAMPLIAKRRLMNFLKYCLEPTPEQESFDKALSLRETMQTKFRMDAEISEAVIFSLGQAFDLNIPLGEAMPRIRMHLKSIGLFGPFPVVIPMYGAGSELSQAFCRKAAVKGCTYILGQAPRTALTENAVVELDSGHQFKVQKIIKNSSAASNQAVRRRTLLVEAELYELMDGGDGACIAFAKGSTAIQCQILGSSAGVCPKDQNVVYLSAASEATKDDFDKVQAILNDKYSLKVIAQTDYVVADGLSLQSYDEIIETARQKFVSITGSDRTEFLPRSETNEDESLRDD